MASKNGGSPSSRTRSSGTKSNSSCASGVKCRMKGLPVADRHACPECEKNIHGGCGIELNPNERRTRYMETCWQCHDKKVASEDNESTQSEDPDAATKQVARKRKATQPKTTQPAAAAKRPKGTSPLYSRHVKPTTSTSYSRHVKPELQPLFENFQQLEHRYTPKGGKEQSHWACICLHCKREYESSSLNRCPPLKRPAELAQYKVSCAGHLKRCSAFIAFTKAQKKPKNISLEGDTDTVVVPEVVRKITISSPAMSSVSQSQTNLLGMGHFTRMLNQAELKVMEKLLLEMIVDCAMPFSVVERGTFRRFVDSLRPAVSTQLPRRTKVKETLLANAAKEADEAFVIQTQAAFSLGHRAGLVVDAWSNVNKVHIEGVILTLGVASFLLNSVLADSTHHGIAVAHGWEQLLFGEHKGATYSFHYHCSDDAGQCGRGRRILALRYPWILWLKCWAHQINLMVKGLLGHETFKKICEQAMLASKAINASSSKWLPQLRTLCTEMYGKKAGTSVFTVGETRWNSTQGCFASQLRIQCACKTFVSKHENSGIPAALMVWKEKDYWHKLEEAELLIRPFCDASFLMQREANTMAHVMLVLLNLYQHISEYCGDTLVARPLLTDLEKRWKEAENPVFFLSFALHPAYRSTAAKLVSNSETKSGNWNNDRNCLCVARLVEVAKFYYGKHELHKDDDIGERKKALDHLGKSIKRWLSVKSCRLKVDVFDAGEDPVEWWGLQKSEHHEIANLSMFLLDCPVQAATCERLFKEFARLHTKLRNRLSSKTVHNMTQVKFNVRHKYPEDLAKKAASANKRGGLAPKNVISAKEHTRIDVCGQQADGTNDDDSDSNEEESDKEEEEEAELETVDQWIDALSEAMPDDDEALSEEAMPDVDAAFLDDCLGAKESGTGGEQSDSDADSDDELDCFEVRNENLLPLPEENDVNFPQENTRYFLTQKSKKYVRTDKYSLETLHELCEMLPEESKLPSIMSAFEKQA
jgi:hypothetical protein